MQLEEAAGHAAEHVAAPYDAGKTIIEHVSNSPLSEPLIHLPPVFGIDFSVTKHVLMLWLVAATIFVVVTFSVRRYLARTARFPRAS
jgi:F-type H+-transporting ATPase subunit a